MMRILWVILGLSMVVQVGCDFLDVSEKETKGCEVDSDCSDGLSGCYNGVAS